MGVDSTESRDKVAFPHAVLARHIYAHATTQYSRHFGKPKLREQPAKLAGVLFSMCVAQRKLSSVALTTSPRFLCLSTLKVYLSHWQNPPRAGA